MLERFFGALAFIALMHLSGCISPPVFLATEVAPRAINGKGLAEDAADVATGKDCRVIEGVTHKNRKLCEERGSPATRQDFKGLAGGTPHSGAKDRF